MGCEDLAAFLRSCPITPSDAAAAAIESGPLAPIGSQEVWASIEGENPLYLPQAKTYQGAAGIGPCLYVPDTPLPPETRIAIEVTRQGRSAFAGSTTLSAMKRSHEELADWLYRELEFPVGAYLMTGTGVVPGPDFTLEPGDQVAIEIAPSASSSKRSNGSACSALAFV